MPKTSLFLLGIGLLLTSCKGTPIVEPLPETATIALLSEKERGEPVVNDELVELTVDLRGLTDVQKVVFYRNGQVMGEDTSAPYTWRDELLDNSKNTYQALAYTAHGRDVSNEIVLLPNLKPKLSQLSGTLYDAESFEYPLQLATWKGGPGEIQVKVGDSVVTRAPLAADGTFTVPLSDPASSLLGSATPQTLYAFTGLQGCTETVVVDAGIGSAAPRIALAHAEVVAANSGVIAPTDVLPPTPIDIGGQVKQLSYIYAGVLIYSTGAVNLDGSVTCPQTATTKTTLSFRLPLVKGWNKVTQQYTLNSNDPRLSKLIFSVGFPAGERWVMLPTNLGLPLAGKPQTP